MNHLQHLSLLLILATCTTHVLFVADSIKVVWGIGNCTLVSYCLVGIQANHLQWALYSQMPNFHLPLAKATFSDSAIYGLTLHEWPVYTQTLFSKMDEQACASVQVRNMRTRAEREKEKETSISSFPHPHPLALEVNKSPAVSIFIREDTLEDL